MNTETAVQQLEWPEVFEPFGQAWGAILHQYFWAYAGVSPNYVGGEYDAAAVVHQASAHCTNIIAPGVEDLHELTYDKALDLLALRLGSSMAYNQEVINQHEAYRMAQLWLDGFRGKKVRFFTNWHEGTGWTPVTAFTFDFMLIGACTEWMSYVLLAEED